MSAYLCNVAGPLGRAYLNFQAHAFAQRNGFAWLSSGSFELCQRALVKKRYSAVMRQQRYRRAAFIPT
jgi:hypothetical protein